MKYDGKIAGFFGEYRWLSNFWMVPLTFEGLTFPSAEHAYQAAKSTNPKDWEHFTKIPEPGNAKKAGRLIRVRDDWDTVKVDAMRHILGVKFFNPYLKGKLLATGNQELIEENEWGDSFWGYDLKRNRGINVLGLVLMRERAQLRGEYETAVEYDKEIETRHKAWLDIPF